ncbi:Outer membrane efflux protein [Polystyrenella longa]|uniref:Outer membrane efflux protein n=1 Tax=Polystyrenella longa TaxID=2528007 RepID=A0A518CHL8_9PLAN|nr:TolC family protein [Polystyrenella longa]QDU78664.1 Outer membrane efflux protein [Polystyrenella longa]
MFNLQNYQVLRPDGKAFIHFPEKSVLYGLLVICLISLCNTGCSRSFWRKQADEESYRLLVNKMTDYRWTLPRIDVTPSPYSRLYEPYDPDKPPLPPDDPAAHRYMEHMSYDGKIHGYEGWHKFGQSFTVENPQWLDQFGITPDQLSPSDEEPGEAPPVLANMTLTDALELATINSREYQTEIENLYLAALDLTFERFQFNIRFLGFGGEPSTDLEYESIPDGQNSLRSTSRFGISQLMPSGAQWVVELANNTLWLFSGENSTNTSSILSYSLVQPLLRGAGRKVVLENLTLQERIVLYRTRDLARFRKTFFTDIVSSYLDLMQTVQTIANLENNIELLEDQLDRLRAASELREYNRFTTRLKELEPGIVYPPEVADQIEYDERQLILIWNGEMTSEQMKILRETSDNPLFAAAVSDLIQQQTAEQTSLELIQLESRFVNSQNSLRQARQNYQTALDQFKLLLGLPTDFGITLDKSLIIPFQLIDEALSGTTEELKDSIAMIPEPEGSPSIDDYLEVADRFEQVFLELQRQTIDLVEIDADKVKTLVETRRAEANNSTNSVTNLPRLEQDVERDLRLLEDEKSSFDLEKERLKELKVQLVEYREQDSVTPELLELIYEQLGEIRQQLIRISQSLQVLQIGLRVELISLEPFDISMNNAVAYALANRLDLMNAKARVMDARRQMEVAANNLEAVLNVRAEGDIRTPVGTRPFDFRGSLSSFRIGLGFTAPLDQINERNNYRASLINYQQAQRDYMSLEDRVKQQVRQSQRNLMVLQQNFETARQSVRINARQYDITVELANSRNPSPNQGLNILNALDSVLGAQNQLIGIFINYETNRLNIYRDMGMMEIDERGVWEDPFYQGNSTRLGSSPPNLLQGPPLPPPMVQQNSETTSVKESSADVKLVSDLDIPQPASSQLKNTSLPTANVKTAENNETTPNATTQVRPFESNPFLDPSPSESTPAAHELSENTHDQNNELHSDRPSDSGGQRLDLQRLERE